MPLEPQAEPQADYQSAIEKLQGDIEGLTTQLRYLVNTRIELTNTELADTRLKLQDTNTALATTRSELQGTNTALSTTRLELQQTKVQLNEALSEQFVGVVSAFAISKPPSGWLECNGQTVSRTDYARLFSKIGIQFGAGDNKTTFHLPNLSGVFVRGCASVDGGHDSGRKFGSYQTDQVQTHSHTDSGHTHSGSSSANGSHYHGASTGAAGEHGHSASLDSASVGHNFGHYGHTHVGWGSSTRPVLCYYRYVDQNGKTTTEYQYFGSHSHSVTIKSAEAHSHSVDVSSAGSHDHTITIGNGQANLSDPTNAQHGTETRPKNIALLFCIKY